MATRRAAASSFVEDMTQELLHPYVDATTQGEVPSIFQVPENIRAGESRPYEPQILAVGPYHHDEPRLLAMESHKQRYLHHLLRRKSQSNDAIASELLKACIEQVKESEPRARRYYSEPVDSGGSHDFVKMMALDGCFILELLLKFDEFISAKVSAVPKDPIFAIAWMIPVIFRDLLKLENQVPFFILEELFKITVQTYVVDKSLRQLVMGFLQNCQTSLITLPEETKEVYHLLHFYDLALQVPKENTNTKHSDACTRIKLLPTPGFLSSVLPTSNNYAPTPRQTIFRTDKFTIPSAMGLHEAGIKFESKSKAPSILDAKFRGGVLDIPLLCFDDSTDTIFRNLIAFENCYPNSEGHVTSYVLFLDCIIDTPKDVAILEQFRVIHNNLGSDEEVSELVNKLCKGITINPGGHYLAPLFEDLNKYCESRYHRYRAMLARDYFGNPWASISFVAATILLLMTLAQVVYAALSYHA